MSIRQTIGGWPRRWLPLAYLLPIAYLLQPVLWVPLGQRLYDYFHSQRSVIPWREVVVVGIDRATREAILPPPVYPLSRHAHEHAAVTARLVEAGARAIVFDLELGAENFAAPPIELADAFRSAGCVYLVATLEDVSMRTPSGRKERLRGGHFPHPSLVSAARGVFAADLDPDSDGIVRRFSPDPRLPALGLESLPERLSGITVGQPALIEFPSVAMPLPVVSYGDVLHADTVALAALRDRIVFVGQVENPSQDFVRVPRQQRQEDGEAGGLPRVVVLAAITETVLRGTPIRTAGVLATLGWNLLWCLITLTLLPRGEPRLVVLTLAAILLVALAVTGVLHRVVGLVFPAGLLLGSLLLCGCYGLISAYVATAKPRPVP